MVSITRPEHVWTAVVAAAATLRSIAANDVSFANKCAFPIALHNLADLEPRAATAIPTGAVWTVTNTTGYNYYRHGDSTEATVISLRFDPTRGSSYDVSIIPPQALYCSSFEACRAEAHGKRGFNVPVQVVPQPVTAPSDRCTPITCGADDAQACRDGFLFPSDSADKYKLCAADQSFQVVFCPHGTAAISSVASGGGGGAGAVVPGNLRGSGGSTAGESFSNAGREINFADAARTTPSAAPASAPASIGFDSIADDGSAAAVAAVGGRSSSN